MVPNYIDVPVATPALFADAIRITNPHTGRSYDANFFEAPAHIRIIGSRSGSNLFNQGKRFAVLRDADGSGVTVTPNLGWVRKRFQVVGGEFNGRPAEPPYAPLRVLQLTP